MSVETLRTTCNRDCPDACSILVDVERATGRAVRLRGDPAHPVTQGFLCKRTNRFLERQYAADRVTTPLERTATGFREVSWDEALDRIAERLVSIRRESGPAAIFHYRSGGSLGLLKPLADYFFERFGPVTIHRGDICGGAGDAAQRADFGDCDANDLFDLENARTIVLWGKNPYVSSPHLIPILRRARAQGTRMVLIDPVSHRSRELADLYLQPRPAADAAVVLGAVRWMLDAGAGIDPRAGDYCDGLDAFLDQARARTCEEWARAADVELGALTRFAEWYADGPSAILVGWGMGRRGNGGAIVRAVDALAAITGNMGRPGGGSLFYWRRRAVADLAFIRGATVAPATISEPLLGPELLASSVRAVWITAGNPVAMLPDSATVARALETRELVVVVDSFLTDTARRAHYVLPTTTLLEDDDLLGAYGHHLIGVSRPVVPRPPLVRTDLEILQALAARVGLADAMAGSARDWKRRLLGTVTREHGLTLEQLEEGHVRSPLAREVLFEGNRFRTPNGKAQLVNGVRIDEPAPGLHLLSLSTDEAQAAQDTLERQSRPLEVTVHPDAAPGIADGGPVWLASDAGRLPAVVKHDPRQRRDTAVVPKGGWFSRGRAANALIRARATDLGEGAAYHDARVTLQRR